MVGFGYDLDPNATPAPATTGDSESRPGLGISSPAPTGKEGTGTGGIENGSGVEDGGSDNSWWVAAAGGAGVGLGVLAIGSWLFLKLEKRRDVDGMNKPSPESSDMLGETKNERACVI